ncbi:PTPA-CTERM sorting domain-containing protein [Leptolyngbya sp. FACHB-261]|uniref:PTPA-CTERM sorting domain-containing protein n=1 Tax=Leptolyngbya sp. FACHB-261 TaxID=2692806 RepID=UPI001683DE13|nr:PTPA-CTERM sorting domain-containing protein [Leptolyngbya sp. FACHB-261]MBD2101752.1 PTPA-CTERM sorting domain-containing protein [Leptolyngbya sp. FACHB-261]
MKLKTICMSTMLTAVMIAGTTLSRQEAAQASPLVMNPPVVLGATQNDSIWANLLNLFGLSDPFNGQTTTNGNGDKAARDKKGTTGTVDINGSAEKPDIQVKNLTPNPKPVPTPALLPGLIGLGVVAMRKRRAEEAAASQQ